MPGDLAALADAGEAVADFAGTFAADVDGVLFSDFEASAVVATLAAEELAAEELAAEELAAEELAAEDAVFSAELATLLLC